MKQLDRYVFRQVMVTTLISLLVLLAVESFFAFMRELDRIGEGEYGVVQIAHYLIYTFPQRAVERMPMALLLGGLMGMGALAAGSELVAMRAGGWSKLRIVVATLVPGMVIVLLTALLAESVAPTMSKRAEEARAEARGRTLSIRGGRGFWVREAQLLVQVRDVEPSGELANLVLYELSEDGTSLRSVARARRAVYEGEGWRLLEVTETELGPLGTSRRTVAERAWSSLLSPRLLEVLVLDPHEMSAQDLYVYSDYLHRNGLDASPYRLALWGKLLSPLSNLVMLFVAMPFVFGPLRSSAAGQRLFAGVMVGLLYYLVTQTLASVGLVYDLSPFLATALPPTIFFLAALVALNRSR